MAENILLRRMMSGLRKEPVTTGTALLCWMIFLPSVYPMISQSRGVSQRHSTLTSTVAKRFSGICMPHLGPRPVMAAQAQAAVPLALPLAPNTELENSTLLDSVVIKVSPRMGSHPLRYGVQDPTMLTPPWAKMRSHA